MNKKLLIPIGIVAVIIIVAIVMMSGRLKGPKVAPPAGQPTVTPAKEAEPEEGRYYIECEVGAWATVGGVRYKTTGIEKHTVGGKSMDLCCSEISAEGSKMKSCADMMTGVNYIISWTTDETTGKFYKMMESYTQDEQSCQKIFDPEGNVTAEMCQ